MAITVGTIASATAENEPGAVTVLVDAGSGSDRVMFAVVGNSNAHGSLYLATYNGVSMTRVGANTDTKNAIFYLINPPTGSHTLSCDADLVNWGHVFVAGVPMSGVHQTVPVGTRADATGAASPLTVDVSSAADELVLDVGSVLHSGGGGSMDAGDGQTGIDADAFNAGAASAGTSTEAGAAPTVTMSWTAAQVSSWAITAVSVKPAAAAGGRTTKNTRAWGLGMELGMGLWMPR